MRRLLLPGIALSAFVALASAADTGVVGSLRTRYAHGIPWTITLFDSHGASLGELDVVITSERADSCLGSLNEGGVKVEFTREGDLSKTLHLGQYGVAQFSGEDVTIDLTAGMCDAYLLLLGSVEVDGSSNGRLSTRDLSGGRDIGTYRAVPK
jgi:hypothetical protein